MRRWVAADRPTDDHPGDAMTLQQDEGLSLHSYFRVISRWKWLIIGATVVVGFLGAAYAWTRTPLYQAGAQMLYQQQPTDTLGSTGIDPNQQQADIGSVPAVVASGQVGSVAGQKLSARDRAAGYSTGVGLQTDPNTSGYTSVVTISGVVRTRRPRPTSPTRTRTPSCRGGRTTPGRG